MAAISAVCLMTANTGGIAGMIARLLLMPVVRLAFLFAWSWCDDAIRH